MNKKKKKGNFKINLTSPRAQTLDIKILDVRGKLIYREKEEILAGKFLKSINLDSYKAGIYLLEISNKESKYTHKIVLE